MKMYFLSRFLPFMAVLATGGLCAAEADQSVFNVDSGTKGAGLDAGRWGLSYENDFFVLGGRDQDYTYGMSVSYASASLSDSPLVKPLAQLDALLRIGGGDYSRYGMEGGFYGFTPEDITVAHANSEDRPFASLVYVSTAKDRVNLTEHSVLRSQLSVGVLGLDIVGDIQDETHRLIGNDLPKGWDNQISRGGELTLRYSLSKQQVVASHQGAFELRQTKGVSLGYLTEVSWGLSFRAGKLNSSWHNFKPEMASYAESSASTGRGRHERFFWGGVALKARAYNAFLQGQFRHSPVKYDYDELRHVIAEFWGGYTHSFINGYYLSYGIRGHTSEIKRGAADRNVIWGGIMIGRKFS